MDVRIRTRPNSKGSFEYYGVMKLLTSYLLYAKLRFLLGSEAACGSVDSLGDPPRRRARRVPDPQRGAQVYAGLFVAAAFRRALFREKATYRGETSTSTSGLRTPVESTGLQKRETSFRRNTKSRFSREVKTNRFRMISLRQMAAQLPWNDILNKK
jgi:hypothetical protein